MVKKKKTKKTRKERSPPIIKLLNNDHDDSKSVWYRFGSLINTINPSNRIMANLFADHYYTVTKINTVCQ